MKCLTYTVPNILNISFIVSTWISYFVCVFSLVFFSLSLSRFFCLVKPGVVKWNNSVLLKGCSIRKKKLECAKTDRNEGKKHTEVFYDSFMLWVNCFQCVNFFFLLFCLTFESNAYVTFVRIVTLSATLNTPNTCTHWISLFVAHRLLLFKQTKSNENVDFKWTRGIFPTNLLTYRIFSVFHFLPFLKENNLFPPFFLFWTKISVQNSMRTDERFVAVNIWPHKVHKLLVFHFTLIWRRAKKNAVEKRQKRNKNVSKTQQNIAKKRSKFVKCELKTNLNVWMVSLDLKRWRLFLELKIAWKFLFAISDSCGIRTQPVWVWKQKVKRLTRKHVQKWISHGVCACEIPNTIKS